MRLRVCMWIAGEWRRLTVERSKDIEGIELVGFPPARARAIRDRLWARCSGRGVRGTRFCVEPAIAAGRSGGLDQALAILLRYVLLAEESRR